MEQHNGKKRDYLLPVSIVIAALLISGSLIYNAGKKSTTSENTNARPAQNAGNPLANLPKVTDDDHILGEKNAPITFVLYSDTECPFCKKFHFTMQRVIAEYGDKVAWVYRHAPIDELHKKARMEAEATECAADLGGNKKFWEYINRLMEITPSNDGLDESKLSEIAAYVGIDVNKFNECVASEKYKEKVETQLNESIAAGMQGTPYSIIVLNGIPKYTIPGAVPFDEEEKGQPYMKMIMGELLKEI